MEKKYLIAYGTAAGSTAEVAQAIGEEMQKQGITVDIKPVETIKTIEGYDAVVVGSAVRVFQLLGKTKRFLRKHKRALRVVPVAFFLVCMTMKEQTTESIERATGFAKPMFKVKEPVSLGLFGGCMDPEKLTGFFAKSMQSRPKEDCRDWEQIREWAQSIIPMLAKE
jgi:menaquinone-dependent protoporphyrinogen oxidase